MLFRYGRHRVVRALGVLYPLTTALVVMGTANHYLMDAAAGVATMGVGFLLARPALRLVDRAHLKIRGRFAPQQSVTVATSGTPATQPLDLMKPAEAADPRKVPSPWSVPVGPDGPEAGDGSEAAGRGERSRMS